MGLGNPHAGIERKWGDSDLTSRLRSPKLDFKKHDLEPEIKGVL